MTPNQAMVEPLTLLSTAVREAVCVLSAEGRILYVNRAAEELFGHRASELLGRRCARVNSDESGECRAILAALGPPPEVFDGRAVRVMADMTTADGKTQPRPITFFPCHDAQASLVCVLALVGADGSGPELTPAADLELQAELRRVRGRLIARCGFDQIIYRSAAMQRAIEQAKTAAAGDVSLLISGERGTGKELFARAIHYASARREAPFSPIDCAALSPEMLERTLSWLGRSYDELSAAYSIPAAGQPGTVYLEEVLALPRDFQARILPFVHPDRRHSHDDAEPATRPRLIVSTSTDLHDALAKGTLREDFYYAVTPLRIELPALRHRREDIPLLAQSLLERESGQSDAPAESFADDVMNVLGDYDWPGNVRELAETVARMRSRATGNQIQMEDLPLRLRSAYDAVSVSPPVDQFPMKLDELLVRVETKLIRLALERSRGNKSQAADLLGISRPRLYRRMNLLGIADD